MIRYIAYVGPKAVKRTQNDSHQWVDFPQGATVDAVEQGFSEERIKFLLKSGVFQLRSADGEVCSKVVVPETLATDVVEVLQPPRHICGCGFVAKNKSGLMLHQRWCKVACA